MGKRKDVPAPRLGGVGLQMADLANRVQAASMEIVLARSALQAVLAADSTMAAATRIELDAVAERLAAIVATDEEGS
jgi:hypothetical protein